MNEEWERRQKKLDTQIASLSENASKDYLIGMLTTARFWEEFPEYDLYKVYTCFPLYDEKKQRKGEIDILLVDDEWAMAVDINRETDERDVERHIELMARILKYPPAQLVPGMKLLGAVAGRTVTDEAKDYAHKCGLFVLELAGESVVRVPAPAGFVPKEWLGGS